MWLLDDNRSWEAPIQLRSLFQRTTRSTTKVVKTEPDSDVGAFGSGVSSRIRQRQLLPPFDASVRRSSIHCPGHWQLARTLGSSCVEVFHGFLQHPSSGRWTAVGSLIFHSARLRL